MVVTRNDLIGQLMEKHNYTKKSATSLVDDFVNIVLDNIRNGNSVVLRGFGRFDIVDRAARSCPNPRTGERVSIAEHKVPKFSPGDTMRVAVKLWEDDNKRGLI